jgi:spermidine synthase
VKRSPSSNLPLIFLLFFLSGATSLVYEVVWLRQLILIFGSTLFATSTILSTFMGGLALGAFVAGRWMDRSARSPLRIYGVLEIGIGVYALLVPVLFGALTPLFRLVWNAGGSESMLLLSLAKFAGIALVLLIPTTLMGASLPVLSREVADDPDRIGGKVGTLYAVNTFGAVAGTFTAGFLAIPGLGAQKTLWVTAVANLLIGAAALGLARKPVSRTGPSVAAAVDGRRGIGLVLVVFAISGFGAMVLEVAWTRALALVLGSSVYAFSLMLLAFLIGLAAGSAFFAGLLRRRPGIRPAVLLTALLGASGLLSYATAFLLQHLPRMFAEIYFSWNPGPNGWFAVQFCFGLMVMFPATFAFGGIFPAIIQIMARDLDDVAGSVGTAYASNTAGTIFGAACAGFFLIPWIGVRNSVVSIGVLQMVLALLVCLLVSGLRWKRRILLAVPILAAVICFPLFRPGWDVLLMNSGVYMNVTELEEGSGWEDFLAITEQDNVLVYAEEGLTASVLVADQPSHNNRYLSVNGKIEASTSSDMETQLMVAHLPLFLHPSPGDVLVIGLASGISVGAAATHPVESIHVVEVEKAMEPAARLFAEHNYDALDDERVRLFFNDARNQLEFSPETYDIIISEPSNPWMTVASNLFTEDFFRMAATRLRSDGIFCQWVQNYCLPADDMRSIVAAFRSAFPNVLLFETFEGVDLVLLGSREPLNLDLDRMEYRMSELRVWMDLARVGVRSPADVLPLFRLGPEEVDRLVEGAPRNSDDNARVEFSAPKALYLETLPHNLRLLEEYAVSPLLYVRPAIPPGEELDRFRLDLAGAWLRRGRPDRATALASELLDGPLAAEADAFLSRTHMR